MQTTEKYGFNLIEMGDTFSPEALNENARKMVEALDTKGDCTVHLGSYVGNGSSDRDIELGFYAKLVILLGNSYDKSSVSVIMREGAMYTASGGGSAATSDLTMTETGFHLSSSKLCNAYGRTIYYAAFT